MTGLQRPTFDRSHESKSAPGRLAINAAGQMLCALGDDQYWTWDGKTSRTFGSVSGEHPAAAGALAAADTSRQWFLGADGRSLAVRSGPEIRVSGRGDRRAQKAREMGAL